MFSSSTSSNTSLIKSTSSPVESFMLRVFCVCLDYILIYLESNLAFVVFKMFGKFNLCLQRNILRFNYHIRVQNGEIFRNYEKWII